MDEHTSNSPIITIDQVHKSYGKPATQTHVLRGINCEIPRGAFTFIVGPSGSGKSTLLYLIGGLDHPTSGTITVGEKRLNGLPARELDTLRRERIGFVFQSFNLLKNLSCIDNVLVPYIPTGEANRKHDEARELLERVGLGHRLNHHPSELSGGEQQRVAITRAILKKPDIILADEPTGELDTETGRQVFELLRELNQERGTTVVTVTHDERYLRDSDTVLKMQDGLFVGPEFENSAVEP